MSRPLIAALHGVGSSGSAMAAALAPLRHIADLVALDGCEPFDGGSAGRQWFSIAGVTEANRPQRVAVALPRLVDQLDRLATNRGIPRDDLVLLGFSQGAIMALAMVAQGLHLGRAIAIAGRLSAPMIAGQRASVLLVYDLADRIMPATLSVDAAVHLVAAGHRVEQACTNGVGHGIAAPTMTAVADWLAATSGSQSTRLVEEAGL